jgi:hypothetical protein
MVQTEMLKDYMAKDHSEDPLFKKVGKERAREVGNGEEATLHLLQQE